MCIKLGFFSPFFHFLSGSNFGLVLLILFIQNICLSYTLQNFNPDRKYMQKSEPKTTQKRIKIDPKANLFVFRTFIHSFLVQDLPTLTEYNFETVKRFSNSFLNEPKRLTALITSRF